MGKGDQMNSNTQSTIATAEQFLPPWHSRNTDGTLGEEYGPSVSTFARRLAEFKNWAWKLPKPAKEFREENLMAMRMFMRPNGPEGPLNSSVPARECDVYLYAYERGHSARWIARHLEIRRETVRCYLKRLKVRLECEEL